MGHSLKVLPANNIAMYKNMDLQCAKCGAVFLINVSEGMADSFMSCEAEQELRRQNPEGAKELPILVKEET